jgi:hypothetical protein
MQEKYTNFWIGTAAFGLTAFFGSMFMACYTGSKTADPNQVGTNRQLGCALWWLALICMWMTWATIYVSQANPLLVPAFEYPFAAEE